MSEARARRPRIVLLGAGHAHLVLLASGELPRPGLQVTLLERGLFRYSGMATGVLAGDYPAAAARLDPRDLAARAGVRFVRDEVRAVDRRARELLLASGGRLGYDYLSLNVGSALAGGWSGAGDDGCVYAVKPVAELHRLSRDLAAARSADEELVVVGGGVSGCEVALCLAARLGRSARIRLLHAGAEPASTLPPGARNCLRRALARAGVELHAGCRLEGWEGGVARGAGGERFPFTRLVLATGLAPAPVLRGLDLPQRGDGLVVTRELHSPGDPRVFAAGDCADIDALGLPKVGVYGVRAAAILGANLAAAVAGRPLTAYRPQRRFLSILNLGGRRALAVRGRWWLEGRLCWWLKDRIDRRFLRRLQDAPKKNERTKR